MDALYIILSFVFAYLCGSIPFGLILSKLGGYGDIRKIGSGNIGATNVLRTGNKFLAAATLILDGVKGFLPVFVLTGFDGSYAMFACLGAMLGHTFPVWLKFKGGKGVATFIGIVFALSWPVGLMVCLSWLAMAFLFKISSLSALVASALAPLLIWLFVSLHAAGAMLLLTALIWYRHKDNIKRLIRGEEPKIGKAAPPAEPKADIKDGEVD